MLVNSLIVWHLTPVNPGEQLHWNANPKDVHAAPFKQGLEEQPLPPARKSMGLTSDGTSIILNSNKPKGTLTWHTIIKTNNEND